MKARYGDSFFLEGRGWSYGDSGYDIAFTKYQGVSYRNSYYSTGFYTPPRNDVAYISNGSSMTGLYPTIQPETKESINRKLLLLI